MPFSESAGQWFAPVRIQHATGSFLLKPHASAPAEHGRDWQGRAQLDWALFAEPWTPQDRPLALFGLVETLPRERAAEAARLWLREHRA